MRALFILLPLMAAACERPAGPPFAVTNVEVTSPIGRSGMSAAYFEIHNNTRDAIVITRIASPQFESAELHETTIEDGVSRMRPVGTLEIAARSSVRLERGGKHVMLMRPVSGTNKVTLQLFAGDDMILSVDASTATAD